MHTAIKQKLPEAIVALGRQYYLGSGREKDYATAFSLFKKAAEMGDRKGQFYLGSLYEFGKGVPQDKKLAVHYFDLAARQGDAAAINNLAVAYGRGDGVEQDFEKARLLYERAARGGNVIAIANIGTMYNRGTGVKKDEQRALEYFRKSASLGAREGQRDLAVCYFRGTAVPQDFKESYKWHKLAADSNFADSQLALGDMYAAGLGVERNIDEAMHWYQKAAQEGSAEAKYSITKKQYLHALDFAIKGDRKSAAQGFDSWLSKATPQARLEDQYYARIYSSLAHGILGEKQKAADVLKTGNQAEERKPWPYPALQYLRHEITASQLSESVKENPDRKTEVEYFIGMSELIDGNRNAARNHLQWVVQNGRKEYWQHQLAKAEMARSI